MKQINMATTPTAAATNDTAKIAINPLIEAVPTKKCGGIYLAFIVSSADPDPMDWNELDSLMSKPPQRERKTRKKPYTKPEAVKKLEQVTGDKHRDDNANGCTRCIIDYLHYKGWQAERINTTGIPIDSRRQVTDITGRTRSIGSLTWRPSGSTVGSADISATIHGRSVKIEVKIGRDRQSEAQRRYQAAVEQAGGLYYIARNFTDFWKWYQLTFVQKGGAR